MSRRVNKRISRKRFIKSTIQKLIFSRRWKKRFKPKFIKRPLTPLQIAFLSVMSAVLVPMPAHAFSPSAVATKIPQKRALMSLPEPQPQPEELPEPGAPAAATPDEVLTGLAGHGCSIGPVNKVGSIDPTLTTFKALSMFMMAWRSICRKLHVKLKR